MTNTPSAKPTPTKSSQQNELHKTIWKIATELRGSIHGWDFKEYVLGIMFYRYISENLTNYLNTNERETNASFDYTTLSDEDAENGREAIIQEKGFFIPQARYFAISSRQRQMTKTSIQR